MSSPFIEERWSVAMNNNAIRRERGGSSSGARLERSTYRRGVTTTTLM